MNPNIEAHFTELPQADIGRSKFNIPFTHLDTFNAGELVPELVMEVLPGDTCKMSMSNVVRMMTPLAPVMDNCFMDVSFWFVPNRLTWSNWKKFMGENETAPWTVQYDGVTPKVKIDGSTTSDSGKHIQSQVGKGSIANHMGIPITSYTYETNETQINALPFRAYALIWNEFFRDENLQNPVNVTKGDTTNTLYRKNPSYSSEDATALWTKYAEFGGTTCLPVCKLHDYFTSCLPGVQKGEPATLPMNGTAPIKYGQYYTYDSGTGTGTWSDDSFCTDKTVLFQQHTTSGSSTVPDVVYIDYIKDNGSISNDINNRLMSLNADLSEATGATVTALRQAFAIQKYLERDARGGTRYIEWLKSHFGVTNPDYRFQRPEYLGGFRQLINMNQVVQSTPVISNSTPLGTTGAYSVTAEGHNDIFTHSFTEHGFMICCIAIRNDNTYQNGIDRMWFRDSKFSYYVPEFANLSEQAVLNREIYCQGTSADTEAFGYQEAWAEYRFKNNLATGEMSSLYSTPLDSWHYADYYTEKPTLGDKWIRADKSNIQRTLAIQNHDQFMGDFYFDMVWTRPMPLYSVPGLIDHH